MENNYSLQELTESTLKYFHNDTLATDVWKNKYALKKNGKYMECTPDHTIERMAKEIFRMESKYKNPLSYKQIYDVLNNFKYFIFGGSVLFGLGNKYQYSSLGNCFFIDNGADSYGGIFNIDESMVQLMKRRGGVGITIEALRPTLAVVNNAAQTSTGAVSFMDRFSHSTREVAQDGRRGALMISMHVDHPDIKEFIMKKDDLTKVTGANISIKITDRFMRAVQADEDYILQWPVDKQINVTEQITYNKTYKRDDGSYIMKVKAKEIWDLIIKQAHKNAEPGLLFWDNIIKESPADCYQEFGFKTLGTNPCGEVPLSSYDSCRLGSINLSNMVLNAFTENAEIDFNLLVRITKYAQRFMDDIVSLEEEKIKNIITKIKKDPENIELKRNEISVWTKILNVLKDGRRTGIGVLGLGDMLAKMGITYGSKQATELINKIFETIAVNSYKESVNLAKERGAFPIWDSAKEATNPFIIRVISDHFSNKEYKQYLKYGRRNIATLSIAPTGSLAILAGTTSGIEPVFKIYYTRKRKINPNEKSDKKFEVDENGDAWEEYNVFHAPFVKWFLANANESGLPFTYNGALQQLEDASDESLNKLILDSPWANSEAHSIDYMEKIRMQGVIQKWIDHSISVTHNLPSNISIDEVNKIYFEAWKVGCKGCTIYREGSRAGVLVARQNKESEFSTHHAPKRPKTLEADYYVAKASGREFAVIIGKWEDTERPFEIFAFENPPMNKNTDGVITKIRKGQYKFVNGDFEIENLQLAADRVEQRAHTIYMSMLLRHGAPIDHIVNVAKKVDEGITSFSSVCRRVLSRYIPSQTLDEKCPDCGGNLIREESCVHCSSCSFSKCG